MANNASENTAVKNRQNNDKRTLLEILKEIPNITLACKKAGIDKSTYYRWRKEDENFLQNSSDAFSQGQEFLNDITQSQEVSLIKEKYWPAIKYHLSHRHPDYINKEPSAVNNESPELEMASGMSEKEMTEIARRVGEEIRKKRHEKK